MIKNLVALLVPKERVAGEAEIAICIRAKERTNNFIKIYMVHQVHL
jgi:hypothetical protein